MGFLSDIMQSPTDDAALGAMEAQPVDTSAANHPTHHETAHPDPGAPQQSWEVQDEQAAEQGGAEVMEAGGSDPGAAEPATLSAQLSAQLEEEEEFPGSIWDPSVRFKDGAKPVAPRGMHRPASAPPIKPAIHQSNPPAMLAALQGAASTDDEPLPIASVARPASAAVVLTTPQMMPEPGGSNVTERRLSMPTEASAEWADPQVLSAASAELRQREAEAEAKRREAAAAAKALGK